MENNAVQVDQSKWGRKGGQQEEMVIERDSKGIKDGLKLHIMEVLCTNQAGRVTWLNTINVEELVRIFK